MQEPSNGKGLPSPTRRNNLNWEDHDHSFHTVDTSDPCAASPSSAELAISLIPMHAELANPIFFFPLSTGHRRSRTVDT